MSTYMILLLVALVSLYVYSYFLHPSTIKVYQTDVKRFDPICLLDKQPVVIQDGMPPLDTLYFKMSSITRNPSYNYQTWQKNKYKHVCILHEPVPSVGDQEKIEVLACPATAKRAADDMPSNEAAIIAFQLSPGNCIILPFHWSYYTTGQQPAQPAQPAHTESRLSLIGIHDLVTYFLP